MNFLCYRVVITGSCALLFIQMSLADAAVVPSASRNQQRPHLPIASFADYIAQAQKHAMDNQPEQSLQLYRKALALALESKNPTQARVARFGIGKMLLWLENYPEAETTYQLLRDENLSNDDHQIALDGLVRSINYQNRHSEAARLVPENYQISNPGLVTSLAQAWFDAGSQSHAESLLNKYKDLLQTIPKNSFLDKQLTRLYARIYNEKQDKIKQMTAVDYVMKHSKQTVSYAFLNSTAATQMEQNKPEMALRLYQLAFTQSIANKLPLDAIASRFGIGKMQLWLEKYQDAEKTYRSLYQEKLSLVDQQVALDGLIRSINNQNRPEEALQLIPDHYPISNPSLVIAIAQAYISNNSEKKAQNILNLYKPLLQSIPEKSSLHKQWSKLNQQILASTIKIKPVSINIHDRAISRLIKQGETAFNSELSDSSDTRYKEALFYYRQALFIATKHQRPDRVILFRMGAVYLSIGDFKHARLVYTKLMEQTLDKADYEVALNGYVQSLSGRDMPMKAFRSIPDGFVYNMPAMLVSASEAALWSNWPYKSMALLTTHKNLVQRIAPNSRLGYRLDDVLWQSRLGTAVNTVGYTNYYEKDSDDFTIQRNQASYSHRFGVPLNTSLFLTKSRYAVPGLQTINGTRFTAQADGWLTDTLTYVSNVSPASYLNWNPVLAKAGLFYSPNDFYSLNALASKDIVESVPSLLSKISVNSFAAGGVLYPAYRIRVAAGALSDHFSDNNVRNGFNLRPSILLWPDMGLYGEFYWRSYTNSIPNSPNYFSPEQYEETRATLRLNRHLNPVWRYYVNAGLGQQRINQDPKTPTKFLEAGIRGPLGKHFVIDAGYGYNSAAGGSATGFARQYGIINITCLI